MVLFEKCCFCVGLEPGCLFLAFLNLLGSIYGMIIAILLTIAGVKYQTSPSMKERESGLILIYTGTALIIFFVVAFSFAIVLLVGLNMKKPKLVKAYIIYCLVSLIIYAILILVRLLTGSGGAIEGVINWIVSVYFLLVMKSYHQRMLEEKSDDRVQNA